MFRWLRNRIKLYKINRQEKELDAIGRGGYRESKEKKDPSIADEWYQETAWQYDSIQRSRKKLVSDALLDDADRFHLPRPQYSDQSKWEDPEQYIDRAAVYVLTPEAMTELRTTIRKERRERRETVEFWVKVMGGVITITTGLVGALIGLFSILKHR